MLYVIAFLCAETEFRSNGSVERKQLIIEIMPYLTGTVKDHRCFVIRLANRPFRQLWMIWIACLGKIHHSLEDLLLQLVGYSWYVGNRNEIDVMEEERNIGTMPCWFAVFVWEFKSKQVRIGWSFGILCFLTNQILRGRTEHGI